MSIAAGAVLLLAPAGHGPDGPNPYPRVPCLVARPTRFIARDMGKPAVGW